MKSMKLTGGQFLGSGVFPGLMLDLGLWKIIC